MDVSFIMGSIMANESKELTKNEQLIEDEVGKLGLQTAWRVASFLKTKIGESIVAVVIETITKKKIELESMFREMTKTAEVQMSSLASLWEDEETKQADMKREMFSLPPIVPPPPLVKPKDMETTIGTQIQDLNEELDEVNEEIKEKTELYEDYNKNIKEVGKFVKTVDLSDKTKALASVEGELSRLEGTKEERNKEADAIGKLLNEGRVDEARTRINAVNAKNLQVGTLKDMLSVVKGDKVMYNKDGMQVKTFEEADFVVPKDKKIVKEIVNEREEYYLLDKDDQLSDKNREAAKTAFEQAEPEMSSVSNLIDANRNSEMSGLNQEVARISAKIKGLQASSAQQSRPSMLTQMPNSNSVNSIADASFSGLAPLTQVPQKEDEDQDTDTPHL